MFKRFYGTNKIKGTGMKYKSELIEELQSLYSDDQLKTDYRVTIWSVLEEVISYNDIETLLKYSK